MNKRFKNYAIIWAIMLAVFNVICFVVPGENKYNGSFWTGYVFITIAFIGQLFCANMAFKEENLTKLFYNMPLLTISYAGLIVMLIFGGAAMAVPGLPTWVGIVVCLLILAFTAIAVVKAGMAAEEVVRIDEKVNTQTSFIKNATADAQRIMGRAKSPEAKDACKKVYEALRFSDPVSSDSLSLVEAQITVKLAELAKVLDGDDAGIVQVSEELLQLITERNIQCKATK